MNRASQQSLFGDESAIAPWERDDESDRRFAEVVFNRPVEESFLYEIPYPLHGRARPGRRVVVPFGRGDRETIGYCVRVLDHAVRQGLKQVLRVVDDDALLDSTMLELARWVAEHYCCAYGQALDAMLPASVKAGAGTREVQYVRLAGAAREQLDSLRLTTKHRRVLELLTDHPDPIAAGELARLAGCTLGPIRTLERRGLLESVRGTVAPVESLPAEAESSQPVQLSPHQQVVLDRVQSRLAAGGFCAMLLHGVTGSGKTEMYLRAIERVVQAGGEAIVLVPEISLTPQTIRRFRGRFPRVAVLHSHLADAERHAQWRRIAAGGAQVVVGARSAVFAPTRKLGLIVIDEEHESTFKQETTPRYHARDVAVRRAQLEQVPLLLGSATPSLESWHAARAGRFELLELPERVLNRPLPEVKLVDLRHESNWQRRRGALSLPLENAMRQALGSGGQVILLLNRRGFSTQIHCFKCGQVEKCHRCDISLVYHRDRSAAICHFCDFTKLPPEQCSRCGNRGLSFRGLGTEKLELEVRAKFPGFPCQRMDTDSMRGRGSHERVLASFRRGELRILLGTQMIAKGLDFPGVTLVGVVHADTALHLPDFRAAERTFQLVAQVAGRTGRGAHAGHVLVQTHSPGHFAIQAAARHDFHAFAAAELPQREQHQYPPFGQLARVVVRSQSQAAAMEHSSRLAERLRQLAGSDGFPIRVLGPAPAPLSRVKNFYRYHLQLQGPEQFEIATLLRPAIASLAPNRRVELAVDVDPLAVL